MLWAENVSYTPRVALRITAWDCQSDCDGVYCSMRLKHVLVGMCYSWCLKCCVEFGVWVGVGVVNYCGGKHHLNGVTSLLCRNSFVLCVFD